MARSIREIFSADTLPKKISLGIGCLFSLIWFIFFILACIRTSDGDKTKHMISWLTYEKNLQFPSFSVCPEFQEGNVTAIECWTLGPHHNSNAIINSTSGALPSCYYFNTNGILAEFNSTIWCTINVTNNYTSFNGKIEPGNAKIFLSKPGRFFDTSCTDCILGQDFWVLITNSFNWVGMKQYTMNGVMEYETSGFYYTYDVIVNSYGINMLMNWTSKEVWNYKNFHFYNFTEFLGTIGGIAALFLILHVIIMFFVSFCCSTDTQYAQIS